MKKGFQKAGVIGAGVMGVNIAALLTNCGIETCLLDLVPPASDKNRDISDKVYRNSIALRGIERAKGLNPSPFLKPEFAECIRIGNIEDDIDLLGDADIVIEAVTEDIEVKRAVYKRIQGELRPGAIVTSNTSGIPASRLCEGFSSSFRKHFAVTHFFNPPRLMKLVEIVPGPETLPDVTDKLAEFCEGRLGKNVVFAGDTHNFTANRIAMFTTLNNIRVMMELGLSFEAIDELTGTVIGFAKSATLRTTDIVGVDTLIHAAENVFDNLPGDERREIFAVPQIIRDMADSRLLGDKTGSGFYKMVIEDDGARRILVLDTRSMTYREMGQVQFDSLDAAKRIADTCSRIMTLYYASDKAGIFTFRTRSDEFIYAANRIPEIAGDILTIDNALKWGFNREMGPFEMWDAVGPKRSAALMESHGYKIPSWVRRMLNKGFKTFYTSDNGKRYHYDPLTDDYREDTKKR